jgi:septal ring factor EnvC (AmiA/AmiB activator)
MPSTWNGRIWAILATVAGALSVAAILSSVGTWEKARANEKAIETQAKNCEKKHDKIEGLPVQVGKLDQRVKNVEEDVSEIKKDVKAILREVK